MNVDDGKRMKFNIGAELVDTTELMVRGVPITSGAYTSNIAAVSGLTGLSESFDPMYIQIGSIVTIYGSFTANILSAVPNVFAIDIPSSLGTNFIPVITASPFGASNRKLGVCGSDAVVSDTRHSFLLTPYDGGVWVSADQLSTKIQYVITYYAQN
jgi:hypothetical protein